MHAFAIFACFPPICLTSCYEWLIRCWAPASSLRHVSALSPEPLVGGYLALLCGNCTLLGLRAPHAHESTVTRARRAQVDAAGGHVGEEPCGAGMHRARRQRARPRRLHRAGPPSLTPACFHLLEGRSYSSGCSLRSKAVIVFRAHKVHTQMCNIRAYRHMIQIQQQQGIDLAQSTMYGRRFSGASTRRVRRSTLRGSTCSRRRRASPSSSPLPLCARLCALVTCQAASGCTKEGA